QVGGPRFATLVIESRKFVPYDSATSRYRVRVDGGIGMQLSSSPASGLAYFPVNPVRVQLEKMRLDLSVQNSTSAITTTSVDGTFWMAGDQYPHGILRFTYPAGWLGGTPTAVLWYLNGRREACPVPAPSPMPSPTPR